MKINQEFKENSSTPRTYYKGLGTATVLAVNPAAEELEKLTGFKPQTEPEYISSVQTKDLEGNDIEAKQINMTLLLQPEGENMPILRLNYRITNAPFVGKSNNVELIDIYNNTVWLPIEEAAKVNMNKNQVFTIAKKDGSGSFTAQMFAPIRYSFKGETQFNHFVKEYNQTKDIKEWDNNSQSFVLRKDLNDSYEVTFSKDEWTALFKKPEDNSIIQILKSLIESKDSKGNPRKIKFIVGVKVTEDGKIYNQVIGVTGAHRKGFAKSELNQIINNNKNIDFLTNGNLEPIAPWVNIPTDAATVSEMVNSTDDKDDENAPF